MFNLNIHFISFQSFHYMKLMRSDNWKLIFVYAWLLPATLFAQQKQLSMDEAMLQARGKLAPENLAQLQFIKGSNDYVYFRKKPAPEAWIKAGPATPETSLLTLAELNHYLQAAALDSTAVMPPMQFSTTEWTTVVNGQKISIDPVSHKVTVLIDKATLAKENVERSSSGYIAYLDDYNLFVAKNGSARQVTSDGSRDIVYASSVHQSEFGITKGTFWSNNGNKLAFYRMDQHMVPDYPIIDWAQRPAKNEPIRYPMAGDSSHHVTVGVYDAVQQKTIWLQTGEPKEQFLTNIAWSPDDRYIYMAVLNRGQNHFWFNQYDASTGAFIKTLFEESDEKYAEPLVPMLFVKNDPSKFIWQSRRDGWNHLYLYDTSGKLIRQLTQGNWEVLEVKGFDDNGRSLFFTSTAVSATSKNLYRLDWKKGFIQPIHPTPGVHNTQVSSSGEWVLDNFSNLETPREIQLIPLKLRMAPRTLLKAANPLADYQRGDLSIFSIRNAAGDSLVCRLFKPVNFDAAKKYPVIVYWYGGPHAQLVLNAWNGGAGDYWFQYMAERGYVVFTLDTRGSSSRGKAFEQSIFRQAGQQQMQDLEAGVAYLHAQSFVDKNNMGLFGWSYGGFMTTNYVLNHPGVFKAAVAGGPVMDWKYYEIMYTERYMDTPQENPAGYEAANLVKQAGKLKDHLLLIHGMQDPVVVQQHSVLFVRAAIDKNVQVDYMIYPGHEHNVLGKDRAHLYQKVTDYLTQYVK